MIHERPDRTGRSDQHKQPFILNGYIVMNAYLDMKFSYAPEFHNPNILVTPLYAAVKLLPAFLPEVV